MQQCHSMFELALNGCCTGCVEVYGPQLVWRWVAMRRLVRSRVCACRGADEYNDEQDSHVRTAFVVLFTAEDPGIECEICQQRERHFGGRQGERNLSSSVAIA